MFGGFCPTLTSKMSNQSVPIFLIGYMLSLYYSIVDKLRTCISLVSYSSIGSEPYTGYNMHEPDSTQVVGVVN